MRSLSLSFFTCLLTNNSFLNRCDFVLVELAHHHASHSAVQKLLLFHLSFLLFRNFTHWKPSGQFERIESFTELFAQLSRFPIPATTPPNKNPLSARRLSSIQPPNRTSSHSSCYHIVHHTISLCLNNFAVSLLPKSPSDDDKIRRHVQRVVRRD